MPRTIRNIALYYLPIVVWALVIFSFSSHPTGAASQIDWQDFFVKKFAHVFVYAVLATLIYRALRKEGVTLSKAGYLAIILCAFYGLTDEFHQGFTPGREPHLRDVGFDTIGAALAIYLLWKLLPKMPVKLQALATKLELH